MWVIAPTTTEPGTVAPTTLATATAQISESTTADTITHLDRIEVTAAREPSLTMTLVRHLQLFQPKHKEQT